MLRPPTGHSVYSVKKSKIDAKYRTVQDTGVSLFLYVITIYCIVFRLVWRRTQPDVRLRRSKTHHLTVSRSKTERCYARWDIRPRRVSFRRGEAKFPAGLLATQDPEHAEGQSLHLVLTRDNHHLRKEPYSVRNQLRKRL